MRDIMRDTLAGAEVLSFVILLFAILGPQPANAVVMSTNVKFATTNDLNIANDYQLNLVSPNPIPIDATSRFGGDVVFMGGSITGVGTTRASLHFIGGATLVHPGQTIHIGFDTRRQQARSIGARPGTADCNLRS